MNVTDRMVAFRLVATDLDGTLLNPAGELTERTRRVVRTLRDAGIVLALATSRRLAGAAPIAAELELSGPLILYDGAQICDYPSGRIVMEDALNVDVAQEVCERLASRGLRPIAQYSSPNHEHLRVAPSPGGNMLDTTYLSRFASQITQVPLNALCRGFGSPLRIVVFGSGRHLRLAARSLDNLRCAWQLLPNGNYNAAELTIFAPAASKGQALQHLAERLGIPREQTFAIGDGLNDVSLLRSAGMSVAMGNGCARAREAAHVVALSYEEDGAAEAIERHVLARAPALTIPPCDTSVIRLG